MVKGKLLIFSEGLEIYLSLVVLAAGNAGISWCSQLRAYLRGPWSLLRIHGFHTCQDLQDNASVCCFAFNSYLLLDKSLGISVPHL